MILDRLQALIQPWLQLGNPALLENNLISGISMEWQSYNPTISICYPNPEFTCRACAINLIYALGVCCNFRIEFKVNMLDQAVTGELPFES